MPAKPLTAEQLADAQRLRDAYLLAKRERGLTQEALALACGYETQSTVSQYVNGKIPLNIEAAAALCSALQVEIASVSPSLWERIQRIGAMAAAPGRFEVPRSAQAITAAEPTPIRPPPLPRALLDRIANLSAEHLQQLVGIVTGFLNSLPSAESRKRPAA
jgi:transcriptional regulator with XRE-family HTH domain